MTFLLIKLHVLYLLVCRLLRFAILCRFLSCFA